jgi:chromosome segregation ATPase
MTKLAHLESTGAAIHSCNYEAELISLRSQLVDAIRRIASLEGIVSHQGQDIDSAEETIANLRNAISEYEAALKDIRQQIADAREAELALKKVNDHFERTSAAHSKKLEKDRGLAGREKCSRSFSNQAGLN